MVILVDTNQPFTEEERQAVVSIQSRFRTYQAQNTLDMVMRGDRSAGAYVVYEAIKSTKPARKTNLDADFGIFATVNSLSKACQGRLTRNVFEVASTVFSAATVGDNFLSLFGVLFLILQSAAIYQAPIVLGMIIRACFEASEGTMGHEQVALWMALYIIVAVSLAACNKATGSVISKRVAAALKTRFTTVTAAHSGMISRADHDSLANVVSTPANALYVQVPELLGELLLVAAATGFVLAHSLHMGLYLIFLYAVGLVVVLVNDLNKTEYATFKMDSDVWEKQIWCKLNDKNDEVAKKASVELIYLGEIVASKGSNMRIWSCVLNNALMMASLVIGVLSLWQGLEEVQSDKISRMECIYCMLYSFLALQQLKSALTATAPALCAELGAAFRVSTFLSLTKSVRVAKRSAAEMSYAVDKVSTKVKTPFTPIVTIVVVAAGAIAAFGKLIQTTPVSCSPVEVTCKLMDGQMQRFTVAQEFDLSAGCTMPAAADHVELLEQCLAAAPVAVSRSQQHTCSVESEKELTAKFSWTTAQGRAAAVTVTNPCSHIDLCANVTCPAIDACHTEGQCVAGLCTTPTAPEGTQCETGICSQGVCGSTAYVSPSILSAASTCSADGVLAVEEPEDWLASALSERKDSLNRFRRQLAAPRRQLSTEVANSESSSSCDPRHGACPGYDQMYCNQPFALNYRETAVYGTHCCSDVSSMSVFFSTTTQQNKVMVKFHKLNNGEFDFQTGGVNYADPVCRTDQDTNMLTQHDFDTIAPLFDENSLVDVATKKYDAFGYPFAEKVLSVQFVLENVMEAKGCTVPQDRRKLQAGEKRRLSDGFASCFLFRGWTTYQCDAAIGAPAGTFKALIGSGEGVTGGAGAFEAASMLFGKFDFSEFGTSTYGSLAAPLTAAAAAADFKTAGAAASTADFGAQAYASITMDFGDFQFLSLGVTADCESKEMCAAAAEALGVEFESKPSPTPGCFKVMGGKKVEGVVYYDSGPTISGPIDFGPMEEISEKRAPIEEIRYEPTRFTILPSFGRGRRLQELMEEANAHGRKLEMVPILTGCRRRLQEKAVPAAAVPASQKSAGFDPLHATQLAKLAAAAPCSAEALEGGRVDLGEATSPTVVTGTGEAKALISRVGDAVAVTLRSNLLADALADDAELVSLEACAECRVNKAVAAEWASLREPLTAALAAQPNKVTLTGHGASAALATLAALDLAEAGVPIADLVTFGEPRVGNSAFAAFYEDSAVYPHFRVTHGRDPVVHAPSASAGFAHVGREVFFNKASSSYQLCARGEDPACSLSVVLATGLDDHMTYMGENFAAKYLECAVAPSSASSAKESSMLAKATKQLA